MSIQSSSTTKSAIVAATMLALEAEGHGLTNGYWGPKALNDDTPLSRQQLHSSNGATGGMENDWIKGAENRMDDGLTKCEGGWAPTTIWGANDKWQGCQKAADICPGVWAGTVASFIGDQKLGDEDSWFGCPYDAAGEYADDKTLASGCCGGFQYMTNTSDSQHTVTTYPILKGGEDTGRVTQCWAANGGVPAGDKWRDEDYNPSQADWEEGQIVDLSWISTANHGGMYEYGIVCGDEDETYEKFSKNRLTFVADDDSGFYQGLGGWTTDCPDGATGCPAAGLYQPRNWERLDGTNDNKSINNGKEILSNEDEPKWAFLPAPNGANQSPNDPAVKDRSWLTENNFTMRNKLRLPTGKTGKCTLGWFWWGMVSAGTFISCMDITISPAGTLRSASNTAEAENL